MIKRSIPFAPAINWRSLVAAIALALPLTALSAGSACVDLRGGEDAGGIGGTGAPARNGTGAQENGGIGGTGAPARGGDGTGGIGGTGAPLAEQGDSFGIVGTITGFASICVNGLEVHYDNATPVLMNGSPAKLKDLAIGQVVSLEAKLGPRGLITREIAVLHALSGPVSQRVAPGQAKQQLSVMGHPVVVTPSTLGNAANQAINPGSAVRVSGMPNADGAIVATRIDHAPASAEHSMAGTLVGGHVHGVRVSGQLEQKGERAEVLLKGQWDGQQLNVREQVKNPATGFIGRVNRVMIEGFVPDMDRSGKIRIGRLEVHTDARTKIEGSDTEVRRGQRITISGRIEGDRQIRADKIDISGDLHSQAPGRENSGKQGSSAGGDERHDDGHGHGHRDDERSGSSSGSSGGRDSGSSDRSGKDSSERVEKVKIEKSEKAEKIEKTEKAEKAEKVEKVEKVDRPDDSGRNRGGR